MVVTPTVVEEVRTRRSIDPLRDPSWETLALECGDLFSSPRWLRVLARGYRLSIDGAAFFVDEVPVGGVAWAEIDDRRGHRRISLPFSDFADPVGTVHHDEFLELEAELTGDGAALSMRLRASAAPTRSTLVEQGRLAWHRAALDGDGEERWARLASGARQNIRKARRNGLTVTVGSSTEAVFEFRRLHVALRKSKYRMLAQPSRFFAALADEFGPEDLRVVTAHDGDRPLASVVLLRHGDTAYYKFNASEPDALPKRANDLVMWTAMMEAAEWGCRWFDFGVSDLDQPGLIRYKRKYASEEGEVVVLRTPTVGGAPTLLQRVLPPATRALTDPRCPDIITSKGGDVLYRRFC